MFDFIYNKELETYIPSGISQMLYHTDFPVGHGYPLRFTVPGVAYQTYHGKTNELEVKFLHKRLNVISAHGDMNRKGQWVLSKTNNLVENIIKKTDDVVLICPTGAPIPKKLLSGELGPKLMSINRNKAFVASAGLHFESGYLILTNELEENIPSWGVIGANKHNIRNSNLFKSVVSTINRKHIVDNGMHLEFNSNMRKTVAHQGYSPINTYAQKNEMREEANTLRFARTLSSRVRNIISKNVDKLIHTAEPSTLEKFSITLETINYKNINKELNLLKTAGLSLSKSIKAISHSSFVKGLVR